MIVVCCISCRNPLSLLLFGREAWAGLHQRHTWWTRALRIDTLPTPVNKPKVTCDGDDHGAAEPCVRAFSLFGEHANGEHQDGNMEGDSLSSSLFHWVRSFDTPTPPSDLASLSDGVALWAILQEIDPGYFAGDLPEPGVNSSSDWTRKWQNLKHIDKQLALYYRDICNGQERMSDENSPDLKAVAAGDDKSGQDLERLIMLIIRSAMASPESNQRMAQRLMGLGRETAMVIASELRNMEEAEEEGQYTESEPVSRDESAYHSEVEETPKSNGMKGRGMGGGKARDGEMYADPLLEREEELLQAQATIDKMQAAQAAAQRQFQELRQDKERLQEAFDAYRSEIETKGRKTGGDDAFKKLQRQTDNDRAYIDDLEGQLQASRGSVEKYERQMQKMKEDNESSQKLRDDLQMLRAENEDLQQKIKANENLKKKIQSLQEESKASASVREDLKTANDKLEELERLKQVQASLEKEVIEKKGLIRNQEYQINELVTTRKHAEYDNRVLLQKLQDARERHDRDHDAIEELRGRLQEANMDDTTTNVSAKQEEEDEAKKALDAENKADAIPKDDGTKHLREQLALYEQQLQSADARLKQASARTATLEESARETSTSSAATQKRVQEQEDTIAQLRKELEGKAPKGEQQQQPMGKDAAMLQRENHLVVTAWYDLAGRLTNNGVSVGRRRREEPRSWIGRQRGVVGPGTTGGR